MKKYGLLVVTFVLTFSVYSQIFVQFHPVANGSTLNGVFNVQIHNSFLRDLRGTLTIVIHESHHGKVAEIHVPNVVFTKGSRIYNRSSFENVSLKFGKSEPSRLLQRTGKFIEGEYEYCYEINISEQKPDITTDYFENCFSYSLSPSTPLHLLDPDDREKICNRKPTFSWQAPLPLNPSGLYHLVLCEVREKQMAVEALSMNVPVINMTGITGTRLVYPPQLPELVNGKTYAWQVHYILDERIILKSEIWTFKIDCEVEPDSTLEEGSYRLLKPDFNGDYYLAEKYLRFAFVNDYGEEKLRYQVFSMKDPTRSVQSLPELKLEKGMNKFSIDLAEHGGFKGGEHYQLVIYLQNGQRYYLRFTYVE